MKTKIEVDIVEDATITMEDAEGLLAERNALIEEVADLESFVEIAADKFAEAHERVLALEAFIIDTRGELPGPQELKPKIIQAISDILPDIKAFAESIKRGTGSAANYEYQFRHAEHRAKLTKTNLIAAKKLMSGMIITVASIADRTANSVNPEDIHHLRGELDRLTADHEIVASVAVDSFLDGVMPELDLMEGTGKADMNKPIRPGGKSRRDQADV